MSYLVSSVLGSQMAERLRNQAINQKVAGSIPSWPTYVVSFSKILHPTCLRGNVPVLTVSRCG